jgi:DNA-binding LacI/PurR family transcriptional regulator
VLVNGFAEGVDAPSSPTTTPRRWTARRTRGDGPGIGRPGPRRFVPVVRAAAFIDAMTRRACRRRRPPVSHSLFAVEGGQAAHHLLGREVTAIVCGSTMALGHPHDPAAWAAGSEDVSVVG